jgi:hypothetical protein
MTTTRDDPAPRYSRTEGLTLALILTAAFAVRAWTALTAYLSTFDTATVGLMAVRILRYGDHPLFFYGQSYFGSLEAWLAAGLFAMFGISEFTLALSPILCSLAWIAATYGLFREEYGSRAGGVAAALMIAPPWEILWYSVGSYGGYPLAFALGTTALWLCLRLAWNPLTPRARRWHALGLGLAAGLALWTHLISAAWLVTGGLVLATALARARFPAAQIRPLFWGILPFVAAASPLAFGAQGIHDQTTFTMFSLHPGVWWDHLVGLFHRPLRALAEGGWQATPFGPVGFAIALAAAALWGCAIAGRRNPARTAVPLVFLLVFLGCYLPHDMARLKAPRYVIPFWTMFSCAAVAGICSSPRRGLRRAGFALTALWALFWGSGDLRHVLDRMPWRSAAWTDRADTAARAAARGLRHVYMVGNEQTGYEGQAYSFDSYGQTPFVSLYAERCQPHEESADADGRAAFGIARDIAPLLSAALRDVGTSHRISTGEGLRLFYDLRTTPDRGRAILPEGITVRQNPGGAPAPMLTDRDDATGVRGGFARDSGVTLTLNHPRRIHRLVLLPASSGDADFLPADMEISVSPDGATWSVVRPATPRMAQVWTESDRTLVRGYESAQEFRFPAVEARQVRIRMLSGQRHSKDAWAVAEIFVFEAPAGEMTPAPAKEDEAQSIAGWLKEHGATMTFADRALSARLRPLLPAAPGRTAVLPAFNPKYHSTHQSRLVVPRPGLAVIAEHAWAGECERMIETCFPGAPRQTADFPSYKVWLFQGEAPHPAKVRWTRQTLLKTQGTGMPDPRIPVPNS